MVAAALAGCTDAGTDAPLLVDDLGRPLDALGRVVIPPDWHELAVAADPGHDHRDASHHAGRTTPNFDLVGYDPLVTDWHGATSGDYFCGSVVERDGRALGVVHSFGSDVAFVLMDLTDTANPRKVGELVMENTQVYDVQMTPDQRYVLVASSPWDSGPDSVSDVPPIATGAAVPVLEWRDACTGRKSVLDGPEAGLPFASGLVLVNIENPRNPYVADFRSFPVRGAHSIRAAEIHGETLLLASVPNSVPLSPAQVHQANYHLSYYAFLRIDETPVGGSLVPLSVYQYLDGPPASFGNGMHDGYLQMHPVTGEALAYLVYGSSGLVILNVDDPANPVALSHWNDWSAVGAAAPSNPFLHEALPIATTWDGRHYTFLGEECLMREAATPTCLIYTVDTTDPRAPRFVSAWTLPVDVQWDELLQYSLHYMGLHDRTLFVSVYHAGLWAIDVSTSEALTTMPSIGAFLPVNESPKAFDRPPRSFLTEYQFGAYALDLRPTVLDLEVLEDGTLVVWDTQSGVYTVRFDASYPAPSPPPWLLD